MAVLYAIVLAADLIVLDTLVSVVFYGFIKMKISGPMNVIRLSGYCDWYFLIYNIKFIVLKLNKKIKSINMFEKL